MSQKVPAWSTRTGASLSLPCFHVRMYGQVSVGACAHQRLKLMLPACLDCFPLQILRQGFLLNPSSIILGILASGGGGGDTTHLSYPPNTRISGGCHLSAFIWALGIQTPILQLLYPLSHLPSLPTVKQTHCLQLVWGLNSYVLVWLRCIW